MSSCTPPTTSNRDWWVPALAVRDFLTDWAQGLGLRVRWNEQAIDLLDLYIYAPGDLPISQLEFGVRVQLFRDVVSFGTIAQFVESIGWLPTWQSIEYADPTFPELLQQRTLALLALPHQVRVD